MLLIYRAKPDQAENTASAQQRKSATQATTAHGNMVATLAKSGTNGYALSNQRSFDAWGNVRIGSTAGNPTGRYCANIGHKQDDESGLIYMRARYYEPTSGRFVSEDTCRHGINWYSYCSNDPIDRLDADGKEDEYISPTDSVLSWFKEMLSGIDQWICGAAIIYIATRVASKAMGAWKESVIAYLNSKSSDYMKDAFYHASEAEAAALFGDLSNNSYAAAGAAAFAKNQMKQSVKSLVAAWTFRVLAWLVEILF